MSGEDGIRRVIRQWNLGSIGDVEGYVRLGAAQAFPGAFDHFSRDVYSVKS